MIRVGMMVTMSRATKLVKSSRLSVGREEQSFKD